MTTAPPDFTAIKERQQKMWSAGDYSTIASPLTVLSENFLEAIDPSAGQSVLDVACGNGVTTLAAARRRCVVTGVDYVHSLIERARERAAVERLDIDFRLGDAEALEFDDDSFDIVLSSFGVMFAPNQQQAASELLRVCRPGGTIGLLAWSPEGEIGKFFRITTKYLPPSPNVQSPLRWGTEQGLEELLGPGTSSVKVNRRMYRQRYRNPEEFARIFGTKFGPTVTALEQMDDTQRHQFIQDLIDLVNESNVATDGTIKVDAEYLEVVAVKK